MSIQCAVYIEHDRFVRRDETGTTDDTCYVTQGLEQHGDVKNVHVVHDYDTDAIKSADIVFLRRADIRSPATRRFLNTAGQGHPSTYYVNSPEAITKYARKASYFQDYENVLPSFTLGQANDSKSSLEDRVSFADDVEDFVLKPASLGVKSGEGVTIHRKEDSATAGETIREYEKRLPAHTPYIVQRYVPGIEQHGDTRIITAAGEPVSAVTRYPSDGSSVASYDRGRTGNTLEKHAVAPDEYDLIKTIDKQLCNDGVRWAGVDVVRDTIEDKPYIIEINGKCPSLLQKSDAQRQHGSTIGRDRLVERVLSDYNSKSSSTNDASS